MSRSNLTCSDEIRVVSTTYVPRKDIVRNFVPIFILPTLAIGGDRTDMEKLMRSYDKEHMKLAMLKHEQTFKEQVYELHRLYRIQKTLMKSFQGARDDIRHPFVCEEDSHEDGIELTLGLGPMGYNNARSRKRGGTTSPSFSSSTITGSSGQDKSRGNSISEDGKGGHAGGGNLEDGRKLERMAKHSPWLIQAVLRLNQNSL